MRSAYEWSTTLERIERGYIPEPNTGCWLWIGTKLTKGGYARIKIEDKNILVHRWTYEHFVGKIPDGLAMDHLCRTRCCVNPDHLEPVDARTNALRGVTIPAHYLSRETCNYGHPLNGDNLYVPPDGRRTCLTCRRATDNRRRVRNRATKQKQELQP